MITIKALKKLVDTGTMPANPTKTSRPRVILLSSDFNKLVSSIYSLMSDNNRLKSINVEMKRKLLSQNTLLEGNVVAATKIIINSNKLIARRKYERNNLEN